MANAKSLSIERKATILQKVAHDFGQWGFCLQSVADKTQNNSEDTGLLIRFDIDVITLTLSEGIMRFNWADIFQDGDYLVLSPKMRLNITSWLFVCESKEFISVKIEDAEKNHVFQVIRNSPFWNKTVTCISEDKKQLAEIMVDENGIHIDGTLYDVQYFHYRNELGIKNRLGFVLSSENLGILKGDSKYGGDYAPVNSLSHAEYDSLLKHYEEKFISFEKKKSFWHRKKLRQEHLYPDMQGSYHVWGFVRNIENRAFHDKVQLKTVTLPDRLKSIGYSAFINCINLHVINLPNSLREIGEAAFSGCSRLNNVRIPAGIKSIRSRAFEGCSCLSNITLPDGLTEIEEKAFAQCVSLESIILPNSIKRIGKSAFKGCVKLKEICFPTGVCEIGDSVFEDCERLINIAWPASVQSISSHAFSHCRGLLSIKLPEGLTSIGDSAFAGCHTISNIVLPNSLKRICAHSFYFCSLLHDITLGDNVEIIESEAFIGCRSLEAISIPSSVKTVESDAFSRCTSLRNVSFRGDGVKLGDSVFSGCNNLDNVSINGKFGDVGNRCFKDTAVNTVFPCDGELGEEAYSNCSHLEDAEIPETVTKIGNHCFSNSGVKSIIVRGAIKELPCGVFMDCIRLREVQFNKGLLIIGTSAFRNCTGISSLSLPDSLQVIGERSFSGCSSLQVVKIPANVKTIHNGAFRDCLNLETVEFSSDKTTFKTDAFLSCPRLDGGSMSYAETRTPTFPYKVSFEDWLYLKDGVFTDILLFFWKAAVGLSRGLSIVLPPLKRNCSVALMLIVGLLFLSFGVISILNTDISWFFIPYIISLLFGIVFVVYGIRSIKYESHKTLYDKELREATQKGYRLSIIEESYLKEHTYYTYPTYLDAICMSFFIIGFALAIVVVIVGAVLFVLSLMGSNSNTSPSSPSSTSSLEPSSDSDSHESGSIPVSGRTLNDYTVNYRYPSGTAIIDDCKYFRYDHQPSIEDIKRTIDSMGWGIDTRKVDVYCIRFGQCIPTATETHSDNLLHPKKSY